jgi:hypothetical protein
MFTVYWDHPKQGTNEWGNYNGDGKQYRRLRYAVLFAKKLRQDPQTGHIDITWHGDEAEEWFRPRTKEEFSFHPGEAYLLEELPKWLLWEKVA